MATDADILYVRRNTNEPTDDTYTDTVIEELIDANGVSYASAVIWEEKAASVATSADVTEAGASHKFSDIYKNFMAMAKYWRERITAEDIAEEELVAGRVRVKKIVRS